jgi:hypothetical protein
MTATARIVIDLTLDRDVTPEIEEALNNLANVMLAQAEDGLYTFGWRGADGQEGPGDSGAFIENELVADILHNGMEVHRGDEPSGWPSTDEERAAFADWQIEVSNGDTTLGFRDHMKSTT